MTIGQKIADARKKENLTQEELADLMGVSRQAISRWEQDLTYPDVDKIGKLANVLHSNCDYLLRDDVNTDGEKIVYKKVETIVKDNSYVGCLALTYLSFIPLVGVILGSVSIAKCKEHNYHTLKKISIGGIVFSILFCILTTVLILVTTK